MISSPDIGFVYPKTGLDADLRFDTTPSYVSAGSAMFDDTNDFVNCGDHANSQMTTGDFSVTYWAKTVATAEQFCVSKQDAGIYDGYRFGFEGGNFRCSLQVDGSNKTGDVDGNATVNDGAWHHFAFTVDRSDDLLCYVDGQLDKTVDISSISGTIDPAEDLILGASYSGGSQNFGGSLCNVGIYKGVVLTQAQIRSIMASNSYAQTAAVVTPSLYYLLAADYDDSTGAQDATNNGSILCGDKARLPSGLDLTSSQMNAGVFSGRGVALDGSADFLTEADIGINLTSTGGAFAVWVKASSISANSHFIIEMANTFRFALFRVDGYFKVSALGTGSYFGVASTSIIVPGLWYHVVASTNGTDAVQLYVNGKAYTEAYGSSIGASGSNAITIGRHNVNTAQYWDGSVSDAKVFDVPLSAAQALELYENPETIVPSGIAASDLVRYYPLSDYDIPGADSLTGELLQDCSGNGKHLPATGGIMEFAQPTIPQSGLRSSTSRCLFNDSNTVVRLSAHAAINCDDAFTYLFWLNTFTANGDAEIYSANSGSGPIIFIDSADAGYVRVRTKVKFAGTTFTWDAPSTSAGLPIGEWAHLAVTFAGGNSANVKYYINGSIVTTTNPDPLPATVADSQGADNSVKDIGGTGSGAVWDGFISEAAVFKVELDADAIAAVYQSGVQGFNLLADSGNYDVSSSLGGWWKIDNPQVIQDLKGSTNGAWNNTPNMATVPEGSTAGLSSFGTLTTDRPSFAFAQPPVGNAAAVRDANPFAGGFRTPPGSYYGTGAFSITFWFRPTQGSSMTSGILYKHNSYDGVVIKQTSATNILVDFNGDDNDVPINCASGATMVNQWTMVCAQRIASDSLKVWTRKAGDASWATATSSTAPGDMTPTDTGMACNWMGDGGGADFRNNPGAMCAFPRVWYTAALTEPQLDSLFESGQRMLIGGNT